MDAPDLGPFVLETDPDSIVTMCKGYKPYWLHIGIVPIIWYFYVFRYRSDYTYLIILRRD
jgi:hypothetical protein